MIKFAAFSSLLALAVVCSAASGCCTHAVWTELGQRYEDPVLPSVRAARTDAGGLEVRYSVRVRYGLLGRGRLCEHCLALGPQDVADGEQAVGLTPLAEVPQVAVYRPPGCLPVVDVRLCGCRAGTDWHLRSAPALECVAHDGVRLAYVCPPLDETGGWRVTMLGIAAAERTPLWAWPLRAAALVPALASDLMSLPVQVALARGLVR